MTQHIYNLDWYASNESVKYPLDSKASCIPTGYEYVPQELLGVITDISFNIPYNLEGKPYLASLTITEDLLSLVICAGSTPLFAFSSTHRSLYTSRYYTLTSFSTGCSGVIVFGESAKTHRCSYKFASDEQSRFLPSVYHRYMDYPVVSIGRKDGASFYQKDVFFNGEGDVKVEAESVVINGDSVDALVFSLNKPEETLQKYIGSCDCRPESGTCPRGSIESINTVTPDEYGNIVIESDGINMEVQEGQLVLSTDYIVNDICSGDKLSMLIGEDTCCEDCQKEVEVDSSSGCSGKLKHINFNQDVEGSGIEIDYRGVTALDEEVELSVSKLSNSKYFSIMVSRPEEGGYCQITYCSGNETVRIEPTSVTWGQNYSLLNNDTHAYPNWITFTVDHCNGVEYLDGNGRIKEENSNLEQFSVSIVFKKCTIKQIGYKIGGVNEVND